MNEFSTELTLNYSDIWVTLPQPGFELLMLTPFIICLYLRSAYAYACVTSEDGAFITKCRTFSEKDKHRNLLINNNKIVASPGQITKMINYFLLYLYYFIISCRF